MSCCIKNFVGPTPAFENCKLCVKAHTQLSMIKMRAGFQGDVSRRQLLNCGGKQASGSEFFSLHQFSQKARTACSSQALSRTNSEKKKKQWGRLGKYAGIWNGNGECLNGFVFVAGELPLFCKNMATAERYL